MTALLSPSRTYSMFNTTPSLPQQPPQEQDEQNMKLVEAPPIACLRCLQNFPNNAGPIFGSGLNANNLVAENRRLVGDSKTVFERAGTATTEGNIWKCCAKNVSRSVGGSGRPLCGPSRPKRTQLWLLPVNPIVDQRFGAGGTSPSIRVKLTQRNHGRRHPTPNSLSSL